jgi:hypothetical protein
MKLEKLVRSGRSQERCRCGVILASNELLAWRSAEIERLMRIGAALLGSAGSQYALRWPFDRATPEVAKASLHFAQKQLSFAYALTRELARDVRRRRRHDASCPDARRALLKGRRRTLPELEQRLVGSDEPALARIASGGHVDQVCARCEAKFLAPQLMLWRVTAIEGTLNYHGDCLNDDGNFPENVDDRVNSVEAAQNDLLYQCEIAQHLQREFNRCVKHEHRCRPKRKLIRKPRRQRTTVR